MRRRTAKSVKERETYRRRFVFPANRNTITGPETDTFLAVSFNNFKGKWSI